MQITRASLSSPKLREAYGTIERLKHRAKSVAKKGEHAMGKVLEMGETAGTAFALGLLNGYHGPVTVAKVPLEVLLAAGCSLGGFLGLAGKHSDHLNAIGNGALSAFAVVKGVQIGAEMKQKHAAAPAGASTATKGNRLTPDEVRAQVERAAAANQG